MPTVLSSINKVRAGPRIYCQLILFFPAQHWDLGEQGDFPKLLGVAAPAVPSSRDPAGFLRTGIEDPRHQDNFRDFYPTIVILTIVFLLFNQPLQKSSTAGF